MGIILITGANGMLAQKLEKQLSVHHEVRLLTRKPIRENEFLWDIKKKFIDEKALKNITHIIHLAGANIGDGRWTPELKKDILESRVLSAQLLLEAVKRNKIQLDAYISASAVGYYGAVTRNETLTENSSTGDDFLSHVCTAWESSANAFQPFSKRVVILRFGAIISSSGGMLKKMIVPTRMYINAVIGSGKQSIPWIDIEDAARLLHFCLEKNNSQGIYNAVSPQNVDNRTFTMILAKVLKKKIFLPAIPAFIIRWIFGEMSVLLLEGTPVSAQKIIAEGFEFQYANLEESLKKELKKIGH